MISIISESTCCVVSGVSSVQLSAVTIKCHDNGGVHASRVVIYNTVANCMRARLALANEAHARSPRVDKHSPFTVVGHEHAAHKKKHYCM